MENVVFNIGCTTKNGVEMDVESMINAIGERTDCTITRTVGFYKGQRENSLKVDVYDGFRPLSRGLFFNVRLGGINHG